jgi:DNA mismatch endonuclease, patch repair protein
LAAKRLAPRFEGFVPSSQQASQIKKQIKRYDTAPELRLRQALFAAGLRFRVHARNLPGRPDVIFPGVRVAIFCDGDFWHGRDWRSRRRKLSKGSNSAYWIAKIQANIRRDRRHVRQLKKMGWHVVRMWESDIIENPVGHAEQILRAVRERKNSVPTRVRDR